MLQFTVPASVDEMRPGDFGLYKAGHVFRRGVPYVVVRGSVPQGPALGSDLLGEEFLGPTKGKGGVLGHEGHVVLVVSAEPDGIFTLVVMRLR
jgi:hypothetical protein